MQSKDKEWMNMGSEQLQIMIQLTILMQEEALISNDEKDMTVKALKEQIEMKGK
ncbi:unknown [Clostridium sp. CAG:632]|nr:unknown [Clostridium sp. CAG:632]